MILLPASPPKNYKISSAFSYNFILALTGETEQEILTKLIQSQHEINSITATENFILGFRLGVRLMAECMDDNDGDIRTGGE